MDPRTEAAIAALADAIREKDWPSARDAWEWLLAHHPYLGESNPHIAAALRREAALVYPHSNSVH